MPAGPATSTACPAARSSRRPAPCSAQVTPPERSPVQLRGGSLHSLNPAVYQRAPALGVNFVRLAVPWRDYQPHGAQTGAAMWDTQRLAELDAAIRFFGRHHIQVLIDLHQYGW